MASGPLRGKRRGVFTVVLLGATCRWASRLPAAMSLKKWNQADVCGAPLLETGSMQGRLELLTC